PAADRGVRRRAFARGEEAERRADRAAGGASRCGGAGERDRAHDGRCRGDGQGARPRRRDASPGARMKLGRDQVAALRRALERAGAREWEIYYEEERELTVEVQDGEVDAYEAAAPAGAGVRVLDGGQMGFSFTTDFGAEAVTFAAETACAAAAASDP